MVDKEIVISLIKGHLINIHLLNGLNDLGLRADNYHLNLGDIIFRLMEIDDDKDELFEAYLEWCTETDQKMIFKDEELLERYAKEIYEVLLIG
jgi:hypothetical protein